MYGPNTLSRDIDILTPTNVDLLGGSRTSCLRKLRLNTLLKSCVALLETV